MRLRREAALGFAALLFLQLTSSALAIALFSRMGPAISLILQENVTSIEAVEAMLTELATEPTGRVTPAFLDALDRARSNVTEPAETALLDTIEAGQGPAFAGERESRERVVRALRDLGQVNRASMVQADERARSLTLTGAWAASLLTGLAFALGILAYRQLRLRLELPIVTLRNTTRRVRSGNWQSRCPPFAAPREVEQIARDLNWILDQGSVRRAPPPAERDQDV